MITVTVFTDPMMGLTYECEPVFEKLREHYGKEIAFEYRMAGLVKDVSDFMNPYELSLEEDEGIRVYCAGLAKICKSEEPVGNRPINMEGFRLFDKDHRSPYPLDTAFHAAKLTDPSKAEQYYHNLQTATIVSTRQTAKEEELVKIAEEIGIDLDTFRMHFHDGSARKAFEEDLALCRALKIHSLPAFLIQTESKSVLYQGILTFEQFRSIITE